MAGHSKWSTIKHQKGAKDKARGKLFAKLLRQVEVAAREGGGDLDANPTLRTMYQKARDNSVPLDTIERAIKRGTGELEGVTYDTVTYEGYAPGGVAVLVEALTDNRNRTGPEVRTLFARNGGNMAEPGAVAWQFERIGLLVVPGSADEDELMLAAIEAGATDVSADGDTWHITTDPAELHVVQDALAAAGFEVTSADLTMVPTSTIEIADAEAARPVVRVLEALDDHDDVQAVHANAEIDEEVLAALHA